MWFRRDLRVHSLMSLAAPRTSEFVLLRLR
jgi:hypothetical protein